MLMVCVCDWVPLFGLDSNFKCCEKFSLHWIVICFQFHFHVTPRDSITFERYVRFQNEIFKCAWMWIRFKSFDILQCEITKTDAFQLINASSHANANAYCTYMVRHMKCSKLLKFEFPTMINTLIAVGVISLCGLPHSHTVCVEALHAVLIFDGTKTITAAITATATVSMNNTRFLSNSNFRQNETIIDGFTTAYAYACCTTAISQSVNSVECDSFIIAKIIRICDSVSLSLSVSVSAEECLKFPNIIHDMNIGFFMS